MKLRRPLIPGKTLLFLDEIQACPSLIKLLRFFHEDRPGLHVVAAGSLLEAAIQREGLAFPVGRVEYAFCHPMDFFEYLDAREEPELRDLLQSVRPGERIPEVLHRHALSLFLEYAMIGGMPEAVQASLGAGGLEGLKGIYSSLLSGYAEDVYKYSSLAESKYVRHVIEAAPLFAGAAVTYDKFGGSNFKSREMARAFDTLEKVMLLRQVEATQSAELPLVPRRKRPRKLLFLDVGLVNHRMGVQEQFVGLKDLADFYRGRIAEQAVGQNVVAQDESARGALFYWAKDKPAGSAEVDFCLPCKGGILAVEVKSGTSGRLRSLLSFALAVKDSRLMRVYGGDFRSESVTVGGLSFPLLSIPFYLAPRIPTMC